MTAWPIRFVLVDTSHPGNIGAAARAMKNMELGELALVRPRQFPHPDAVARASGADDLLAAARVCATLSEALAGCGLVLASTSRDRPWRNAPQHRWASSSAPSTAGSATRTWRPPTHCCASRRVMLTLR